MGKYAKTLNYWSSYVFVDDSLEIREHHVRKSIMHDKSTDGGIYHNHWFVKLKNFHLQLIFPISFQFDRRRAALDSDDDDDM